MYDNSQYPILSSMFFKSQTQSKILLHNHKEQNKYQT